MQFNKRVDLLSNKYVDTSFFNSRLNGLYDNVYITFVAIKDDNKQDAWEDQGDSFLRIALPYEAVVGDSNVKSLMIDYLMSSLPALEWLNFEEIRSRLLEKLAA
ncbi:MAG: hypothetical protein R2828_01310 [Saprospiraceae bacterium]